MPEYILPTCQPNPTRSITTPVLARWVPSWHNGLCQVSYRHTYVFQIPRVQFCPFPIGIACRPYSCVSSIACRMVTLRKVNVNEHHIIHMSCSCDFTAQFAKYVNSTRHVEVLRRMVRAHFDIFAMTREASRVQLKADDFFYYVETC
jgi:hypothetical protein